MVAGTGAVLTSRTMGEMLAPGTSPKRRWRPGQGVVVTTNGENGEALIREIVQGMAAQDDWPGQRPWGKGGMWPSVLRAFWMMVQERHRRAWRGRPLVPVVKLRIRGFRHVAVLTRSRERHGRQWSEVTPAGSPLRQGAATALSEMSES